MLPDHKIRVILKRNGCLPKEELRGETPSEYSIRLKRAYLRTLLRQSKVPDPALETLLKCLIERFD